MEERKTEVSPEFVVSLTDRLTRTRERERKGGGGGGGGEPSRECPERTATVKMVKFGWPTYQVSFLFAA